MKLSAFRNFFAPQAEVVDSVDIANPALANVTTINLVESVEGTVTVGPESAHWLSIILDREVPVGEPFDLGEVAMNNPNVNLVHIFSRPLQEQAEEILRAREG